ncbi:MAG: GNAT family N-acetyltransferase [Minwuia sp.]|uniref:GNAT family N-acetyltransferase n=1 Tax=Minwuia sp. TaxID=2493630 RepID=UPI003A89313B
MADETEVRYETGAPVPGWTGAEPVSRDPMQGRYCTLELMDPERHGDDLFAVFQRGDDVRDWLYLPYGPFGTHADFDAWIGKFSGLDDPLFFAIREGAGGRTVGVASYLNIGQAMGTIEVGHIHFSPAIQRSPVATEAMYLMMRRAFESGYRRYEWKCDSCNLRSRRAAQRFGFSWEGLFRQHYVVKGRNRDTAWFACIDGEWPALKAAYETWLEPDNFDAKGRQRQSLSELTAPIVRREP